MKKNDNKFLIIDSRPYGLFSIFLHTIDNLKWAEDNDYVPYVRWGPGRVDVNEKREGAQMATNRGDPKYVGDDPNFIVLDKEEERKSCLYYNADGYNNSGNPWEYYFEPVSSATIDDVRDTRCSISDIFQVGFHDLKISSLNDKFLIYNLHSYTPLNLWQHVMLSPKFDSEEEYKKSDLYLHRNTVHQYIKKYVKIKQQISAKIDDFAKKHLTENTLGVHIRGTDKKSESAHGQRPFVSIEDYIRHIEKYIRDNKNASIFVASDNNEAIRRIFQNFPRSNIVVSNCTRMPSYGSVVPIHLSQHSGPLAGEEALIDCVLLSRCSHIVCTDSNLSAAALYFNPDVQCSFVNKDIS